MVQLRHTDAVRYEPESDFKAFLQNRENAGSLYNTKQCSKTIFISIEDCFSFFNPQSHGEYRYAIKHWTETILSTLEKISQ